MLKPMIGLLRDHGVQMCLTKPVAPESLLTTINDLLPDVPHEETDMNVIMSTNFIRGDTP